MKDPAYFTYQEKRIINWNTIAVQSDSWKGMGKHYHDRLERIYQFFIPPGQNILELGCGQGDLLASLKPFYGLGVDFSEEMLKRAQRKHPECHFQCLDVHDYQIINVEMEFDYIILSDLINDLWDFQTVLEIIQHYANNKTRILINTYSHLWEFPLTLGKLLNLAKPVLQQNWFTKADVKNLLSLCGFEVIRSWEEILFPFAPLLIASFLNQFIVRFWPFSHLALSSFILARKTPTAINEKSLPSLSIVIPARNEAGNIHKIIESLPDFRVSPELIFVEGHSTDNTYEVIQEMMNTHPEINCKLHKQSGIGKRNAVREGFERATGDVLMILDADLSVPSVYLPRFYEAIASGKGEFINGVRLVYPMEKRSMRFINLLGNKFFSIFNSWTLGQDVKDTLCGTKVFWRHDYNRMKMDRHFFGNFDPFGDFDLLLGAAKLNLKIVDMPVRYRERTYGKTNIQRWKHGWMLLKMAVFFAWKLKFY